MSITKYIEAQPLHDIIKPSLTTEYRDKAVSFEGAPRKHPYDNEKMLLIENPLKEHAVIYEFNLNDILHAENMPNVVNEAGKGIQQMKIWVKKGCRGLELHPFIVGE